MEAETTVSVVFTGDGGQRLSLQTSGYQRPKATDDYDANWLHSTVSITAGPFAGNFPANLSTYDFAALLARLERQLERLEGHFEFESIERDVILSVEFHRAGNATVSGSLRPGGASPVSLSFEFETDQSALAHTVQQLKQLLRLLPVRVLSTPA